MLIMDVKVQLSCYRPLGRTRPNLVFFGLGGPIAA